MIRLVITLAVGAALAFAAIGAGALAVVELGLFDARATTPHNALVAWAAHKAMKTSMGLRARSVTTPNFLSPEAVRAGALDYASHCQMCHGGPGTSRQEFVSGMTPTPPYLLDSARTFTPAQLYVIVNNGVKMTAMPAWDHTLGSGRVWNVVAFLEALPYLSEANYAALTKTSSAPTSSPAWAVSPYFPDPNR